jgi:hypothetical protein
MTKYACSQRGSLSFYVHLTRAVSVLRQSDASFKLQRAVLNLGLLNVNFVVDEVTTKQVSQ